MQTNLKAQILYDRDFYGWIQQQVELLKERQWEKIDLENLIEELDSLGKQQRQELRNRLGILIGHLLKWHYQPEFRSRSWWGTIREQREEIEFLLEDNPSLKPYLSEALAKGYRKGITLAVKETQLPLEQFPPNCPFTFEQVMQLPVELVSQ